MDISGEPKPNRRLDGWGEIATYLRRDVRTVQRWEKSHGLPVHRDGNSRPKVWAFTGELDDWWEMQEAATKQPVASVEPRREPVHTPSQSGDRTPAKRKVLVFAGALLCAAGATVISVSTRVSPEPPAH